MIANDIISLIEADQVIARVFVQAEVRTDQGAMVYLRNVHRVDFEPILNKLLGASGWYVSRTAAAAAGTQYFLEARVHPAVPRPKRLYHASPVNHRASIEASGLTLATQSKSWTNRKYDPPRVHFARTRRDALVFIQSATMRTSAHAPIDKGSPALARWDLYELRPKNESFHLDIEMNTAVWTTVHVPFDRLHRTRLGEPSYLGRYCGSAQRYLQQLLSKFCRR